MIRIKTKKKIFKIGYLVITLGIMVLGTCLISDFQVKLDLLNDEKMPYLKENGYWVLPDPIVIDDTGSNNWTYYIALGVPWLSGEGTSGNPYMIENVSINGGNAGSCIEIANSIVYFVVKNCSLTNSNLGSYPNYNAGIKLVNVENGQLIDNDCSNNNGAGIFLYDDCDYNFITGNTVNDNDIPYRGGIFFDQDCDNNVIIGNTIQGSYYGICINNYCDNTIVSDNTVNNNNYGMELSGSCYDSTISGNNAGYNMYHGISISNYCHRTDVIGNNASENGRHGISLRDSNDCDVLNNNASNLVSDNQEYGIYLESCDGLLVSGNEANDNFDSGIYLAYIDNSAIRYNDAGNVFSTNQDSGIEDISSDDTTINGNNLYNNCNEGIIITFSDTLTMYSNTMQGTGLSLYRSTSLLSARTHTIYSSNQVNGKPIYYYVDQVGLSASAFNNAGQVFLINCSQCTISGVDTSQTTSGIFLLSSSDNIITENTASENKKSGIYLTENSNNNVISRNNATKNMDCGIYLYNYCDGNTILENNVSYNDYGAWSDNPGGIRLENDCDNNTISVNIANRNFDSNGIILYQQCDKNNISGNQANENGYRGIYLFESCINNVITKNNASNNNYDGIYMYDNCSNNTVIENDAINNDRTGIGISYGSGNTISGNNANYNGESGISISGTGSKLFGNKMNQSGLSVSGTLEELKSHDIDTSNLANEKPIYYYVDEIGLETSAFNNAGQIFLINCSQCTVSGVDTSLTSTGIYLHSSSFNDISENMASNNKRYGIVLNEDCNNNTISDNNASNNMQTGISVSSYCDNNTISDNNASNNIRYGISVSSYCVNNRISKNAVYNNDDYGIYLSSYCNENFISGNNVSNRATTNQERGIYLYRAHDNLIVGNWIQYNIYEGIYLRESENNSLYLNSLVDNEINAVDDGLGNQWDNGAKGNYWSNYTGSDIDPLDGIGDQPHDILGSAGSQDRYPLISPQVDRTPYAHFTASPSPAIVGGTVQFTFDGSEGDPDATFSWDFGDGSTSALENPTHQYATAGVYNVTLNVTDDDGDTDSTWELITVNPPDLVPYAHFTASPSPAIVGGTVQFTFDGSEGDPDATFSWDFGDGFTSALENPTHQYAEAGVYNVTLTVTDADDDTSFWWLEITVVESLDLVVTGLVDGDSIARDSNFEIRITLSEDIINDVSVRVLVSGPVQAPIRDSSTDIEVEMSLISGAWVGYWDASACALGDYAITITVLDKNDNVIQTQVITVTLESGMQPPSTDIPFGIIIAVISIISAVAIVIPAYIVSHRHRNKSRSVRNKSLNKFPKPKSEPSKKYRSNPETAESMLELQRTESELEIFEDRDTCQIHKGFIEGVIFSCPKCKAKYCMKCASLIAKKEERCWLCGQDFREEIEVITSDALEVKPIEHNHSFNGGSLQEFLKVHKLLDESGDVCLTLVPSEFLTKVESLSWENNEDKIQFLKEIMAIPLELREECINEMIQGLQNDFDGNNDEVL